MRWPTGTDVTRIRQRADNRSRFYLGVQKGKERTDAPPPLMVGQHYALIAADAYTTDGNYLTFNAANFLANSDIQPQMTLALGTLTDPFLYGSARIRLVDAGNNRLCLEPNDLDLEGYFAEGTYIWVDGVYRLYRILPRIVGGEVYEDGDPDSTGGAAGGIPGRGIRWPGNANYYDRPIARMGSPRFAWTNETIDFYGWRSNGRGGNVIQGYVWDFDGGVCVGLGPGHPGSPGHPIHVRWPSAGEYIASLTVRDDSGKAGNDAYGVPFTDHRAVRPVLVYDRPGGANPPYSDFEVTSLRGSYGSGWSASVTVYGTADKSEFPDNALIIIYCEDWHGGVQGSRGGWYGQEGILFVGHIRADSVKVDSEKSSVSFEAQTIEQWMKEIDCWPINFEDTGDGAPDEWHEFEGMTVEDCLWFMAEFRSTLKNVTDCFFASDVNTQKALGFLDITEDSLYSQMSDQIGSCFFGKLSASRHGSVHLCKHKNMLDLIERTWWGPPIWSFQKQDWRDELQIGEERQRDSVAQVDFVGFFYDANGNPQDCFSLAPERQTNFGRIEKVTGILLTGNTLGGDPDPQDEADILSGLYRAWQNTRFPHIRVPVFNNRFLEPATLDYFAIELDAADTVRGYDWDGKEFLCTEVSYDIDHEKGRILADITGEASTWGPRGVAGPYPSDPPPSNPPDEPPEYWDEWAYRVSSDPPPWCADEDGDAYGGMLAYIGLATGEVIRGTGLGVARPGDAIWHNCGQVDGDGIYWMALDEFDLKNTAMVCSAYAVYKTTNLSDDTPTWETVLTSTWPLSMVRSSPLQEDLWVVIGVSNTHVLIWVSTDGGDTWTARTFTSGDADAVSTIFLELSTHNANRAWAMWIDNADDETYIASTTDLFATQTIISFTDDYACFDGDPSQGRPCCHHRAFDNDDDTHANAVYGGAYLDGTDYARAYLGATCTNLYDGVGADPDLVGVRQVGCGVGTRNRWWALAHGDNTDDDWVYGFWVSDGGAWTEQYSWEVDVAGDGSFYWRLRDCHNFRRSWQWYAVARDGVWWPVEISMDRGEHWEGIWSNWPAFTTDEGLGDPDALCICSADLVP